MEKFIKKYQLQILVTLLHALIIRVFAHQIISVETYSITTNSLFIGYAFTALLVNIAYLYFNKKNIDYDLKKHSVFSLVLSLVGSYFFYFITIDTVDLTNELVIIGVINFIQSIAVYYLVKDSISSSYFMACLIFVYPVLMFSLIMEGYVNDLIISFSLFYIFLFSLITYLKNKHISCIIFIIIYVVFILIVNGQYLNYDSLFSFFSVFDIYNVQEAVDFLPFVKHSLTLEFYVLNIVAVLLMIAGCIFIYKNKQQANRKVIVSLLVMAFSFRFLAMGLMYEEDYSYRKKTFLFNVSSLVTYEQFTYRVGVMQIAGVYEYIFQDLNNFLFNDLFSNNNEELNEYVNNNNKEIENEYTGSLQDENLILIMAETLDSWVVDEETMPTLSMMMDTGINFNNYHAVNYSGGRTHNTEFALNTGFYIPTNYNIYEASANNFDYSLAHLFKEAGYLTTSIHSNYGDFYARSTFHEAWDYDNSYFLYDEGYGKKYYDDRYLNEDEIYDMYVSGDEKFMSFVITYSGHGGYIDNKFCEADNVEGEEACYRNVIGYTDKYLEELIIKLEEDGLLDNTTIVVMSDHYSYMYKDSDYLKEQKNVVEAHDVEKVPLVIWNNRMEGQEIDLYVDQVDMLPTIANLFGLDYNPNFYMGDDVFSSTFNNYLLTYGGEVVGDIKLFDYAYNNKEYGENVLIKNYSLKELLD